MGVPVFFRYISKKFPGILVKAREGNMSQGPLNGRFDNLYFDLNSIIHPVSHPEDRPAPKNEQEIFLALFEAINRFVNIVRPQQLIYLAIDGPAPFAKQTQQRSRRFRAAKESEERQRIKDEAIARILASDGTVPEQGERFDSNSITPGTAFMDRLTVALEEFVCQSLASNPLWLGLRVILSDSNVPGEGEHKVMDFIRSQRCQRGYNPNTRHCIVGADADLVFLGLASFETNFTIIREDVNVKPRPRPCGLCGIGGHDLPECPGSVGKKPTFAPPTEFVFVKLGILKNIMFKEMVSGLRIPLRLNKDRVIADWIMLNFFVGNDFLPHLPSLEIREGAIERLMGLWRGMMTSTKGYLVENGKINIKRLMQIMRGVGKAEDQIFQKRRSFEIRQHRPGEQEPVDEVRLWQPGWKERYFQTKFGSKTISSKVAQEYLKGLRWVLEYYFKGCPDWKWFYPFHYAPFASDIADTSTSTVPFPKDSKPLTPLEQLMSVFPASSGKSFLPPALSRLMTESEIKDLYPEDFKIDMNGQKQAWRGVALLPFVDIGRLQRAITPLRPTLTNEEKNRDRVGDAIVLTRENRRIWKNPSCQIFAGPGRLAGVPR